MSKKPAPPRPAAGGQYVRDPKTGKIERATQPRPAPAAKTDDKEGGK